MWIFILLAIVAAVAALFFVPAFKGYRTQIFGWLTTAFAGAVPLMSDTFTYLQTVDWTRFNFSPKTLGLIGVGIGLMIIALRFVTKGPVGEK